MIGKKVHCEKRCLGNADWDPPPETKNVFFNDEYLINYSTYNITTRPIRKIDSESSSQFFNFKNILTQITIKKTVN